MFVTVKNDLVIHEPTKEVINYCKKELTVFNPDYVIAEKLGRNTRWMKRTLDLYATDGNNLILPFGCLDPLWKLTGGFKFELKFNPLRFNELKGKIELYDYQEKALNKLLQAKNGILQAECGSGKGLPLDAKIYTPTGYKLNKDLMLGDEIIGKNGKSTKVIGIYDKGLVDAYKLTFSDNVTIVCDKDHLWSVQNQSDRYDKKPFKVMGTTEIYNLYKNENFTRSKYLYIPIVEPVQFDNQKVEIDSWLLGFLIGDGTLTNDLRFSTSEKDILEKVKNKIKDDYIKYYSKYDYIIRGGDTLKKLRKLGILGKHSYEKFIPNEYKYNDINTRLEIIRGLFDSDGYIDERGGYEYSTSSKNLALDFVEIIQSLGGTAKIKDRIPYYTYNGKRKKGRISYRIHFKLYKFKPFTSEKHSKKYKERTHYNQAYRIIKKIEKVNPIISRCIKVDAEDELFVTDNFIVTHNTQIGLAFIEAIGGKTLWLTHTHDLLIQSMNRAKGLFSNSPNDYGTITEGKVNIGKSITFATVQTISKLDPSIYKDAFDCVVIDECVSGDTEILTDEGFKRFDSLSKSEKIAQYNNNGTIEFIKPLEYIEKDYEGKMYEVTLEENKKVLMSPHHVQPLYYPRIKSIKEEYIKDIHFNDCKKLIISGKGIGKKIKLSYLDKVAILSQADGSINRIEKNEIFWIIQLKKERKIKRFLEIISKSNLRYNEIKAREGCRRFAYWTPKNITKRLDTYFKLEDMSFEYSNDFIEEIAQWDGYIYKDREIIYYSSKIKENTSFVASVAILGGFKTNQTILKDNRKETFSDVHRIHMIPNRYLKSVQISNKKEIDYKGKIYCVKVPSQKIILRANGFAFISGNCHHAAGTFSKVMMFYKVISNINCRHKIGLSATLTRSDGLIKSVFALIGPIVHTISKEEVGRKIIKAAHIKIEYGKPYRISEYSKTDGMLDYNKLIDLLSDDPERNLCIVHQVILQQHKNQLILCSRVKQVEYLYNILKMKGLNPVIVTGKVASKKRDFNSKIIISTYALAKEGLDIPTLDVVHFATPQKDYAIVKQSAGRVERFIEGKSTPLVLDYVDTKIGYCVNCYIKRKNILKK